MGLQEDLLHETIADMPLRPALTATCDTPLRQAIEMMRGEKLGCVFVVDGQNRPLGKFNERQVLKVVRDRVSLDDPIGDHYVKLPDKAFLKMSDPAVHLMEVMSTQRLRFVCVVDDDGKVKALTGQRGLMEYITERFPRLVKAHMMSSKLFMNQREGA